MTRSMDTQPEPIPTPSDYAQADKITAQAGDMPDTPAGIPIGPTVAPSPTDGTKPLKNRKHERFARLIAQGQRSTDAYIKAVSATCARSSAQASASMLLKRAHIAARVDFLSTKIEPQTPQERAKTLENIDLTRNNLLDKLREIIVNAANPSAAISAIESYAKLASIGPEERDTGQLTPDQAARYAAAAADNLQARLRDSGAIVVEIITGTARIRQECATLDEAHKLLDTTTCSVADPITSAIPAQP